MTSDPERIGTLVIANWRQQDEIERLTGEIEGIATELATIKDEVARLETSSPPEG